MELSESPGIQLFTREEVALNLNVNSFLDDHLLCEVLPRSDNHTDMAFKLAIGTSLTGTNKRLFLRSNDVLLD